MALNITSLNSGSNGNCYYIGNNAEAVLIDAGISCRETEKRMRHLGLSMRKVKGIFISHEHSDHIKGVKGIALKYKLPVFITEPTAQSMSTLIDMTMFNFITAYQPVMLGGLIITAFTKLHDAADPHSFIVSGNGVTVGIFTDIGAACSNVITHFGKCNAAFLEANYDNQLLEKGRYPVFLKNRIRGGMGHLSNHQALEIFTKHRPPFMTHLFLSHLSKDNNCPELVQRLFNSHAKNVAVIIASRYQQTALYTILPAAMSSVPLKPLRPLQLRLF